VVEGLIDVEGDAEEDCSDDQEVAEDAFLGERAVRL